MDGNVVKKLVKGHPIYLLRQLGFKIHYTSKDPVRIEFEPPEGCSEDLALQVISLAYQQRGYLTEGLWVFEN